MQAGQETDFVLVSCTGLGIDPSRREQVVKFKRVSESQTACVQFFHIKKFMSFLFI